MMVRDGLCRIAKAAHVASWIYMVAFLLAAGCSRELSKTPPKPLHVKQSVEEDDLASVALGDFRIQESRLIENQKIDIRISIQAAVAREDQQQLEQLVNSHRNAVRDQILLALRTAESPEFDEPELHVIRHRILLKIATVLGNQLVKDLYITDYFCQID